MVQPGANLGAALGGMLAAFWLARLTGRIVLGGRQRFSARPSHLFALAVAVTCGVAFVMASPLSPDRFVTRVQSLLP